MEAKARTLLEGLRMCIQENMLVALIESDSLMLYNMLNNAAFVPWKIDHIVHEILGLLGNGSFVFSHIYREANKAIDHLSNLGSNLMASFSSTFANFPLTLRGILIMDL
ncbi:hypothetical protein ACH5RR_008867 [Cinchona calisaya]|uniref:RNase H type-1 domain-containing protein n=1 Tax=Cinchona calisaya TaxID=153742 RepID=A0ABD3AGH7_9GENT